MTGIALPLHELPAALLNDSEVQRRVYVRAGHEEVRFLWEPGPTLLPVRMFGSVGLIRWGSQKRHGSALPYGGWVGEDRVEAGCFYAPEPVVIPAMLGHEGGVWFVINEGVRGVLLNAPGPVVYMLMRRSTNYYRNMTQQTAMMPVLVNQVI